VVYLKSGRPFQIGTVQESLGNNQYQFKTVVTNVPVTTGLYEWQVRLEDFRNGEVLEQSPFWPVQFLESGAETTTVPAEATSEPTDQATESAAPTVTPEPQQTAYP
jgi:hypothetical protein